MDPYKVKKSKKHDHDHDHECNHQEKKTTLLSEKMMHADHIDRHHSDHITDIFYHPKMTNKKKVYAILKKLDTFKIRSGIYHKNKLKYSTRCSIVSSLAIFIALAYLFVTRLDEINKLIGENKFQIGNEKLVEYYKVKPELEGIRKRLLAEGE